MSNIFGDVWDTIVTAGQEQAEQAAKDFGNHIADELVKFRENPQAVINQIIPQPVNNSNTNSSPPSSSGPSISLSAPAFLNTPLGLLAIGALVYFLVRR